jgi:DNA recombination protein RmuC
MRSQGRPDETQAETRLRVEDIYRKIDQLGLVFSNPGERGRAGEIVLENLLEITGMKRHQDFKAQVAVADVRADIVLNLPGRGRLIIDSKFPLNEFRRAEAASTEVERRTALAA